MKELRIGELVSLPIVQGGMGVGISLAGLASAVANQGGIGVISTAGIGMDEKDFYQNFEEANIRALRKEIRKAKELTKGVLGVNIMVAMSNFKDMVTTAIDERIDVIFSGAGLPLELPKYLPENSKTKLIPIISSAKAARIITKIWLDRYDYLPDGFVLEGPKAGGHLGYKHKQLDDAKFQLEKTIPEVLEVLRGFEETHNKKIPLIAGGGVYTGEDIYKILHLGASAVQMGTRFVTTEECDASPEFKKTYIDAKKEDIGIIKSPVGMPGRAVINDYIRKVEKGEKMPYTCPYHCISTCEYKTSPYCISLALINAQKGRLAHGFAFAGTNAYRAREIITVKQLFEELNSEYQKASEKSNS